MPAASPTPQKIDLVAAAMTAHRNGDLARAEELYADILKRQPNVLAALNGLGIIRSGQQKHAEAAELFKKAIGLNPDVAEFYMNLAAALHAADNTGELVTALQGAVKLQPENAKAHYLLARTYEKQEKPVEAITHYKKVLEREPEHVEALVNCAELIRAEGDWTNAEVMLLKADALTPNHYGIHNNLGTLRQVQNRIPEAIAHYRRVVELNPKFIKGYNNLGVALQDLGDFQGAMQAYDAALAQDPQFMMTHYNKALCLLSFGKLPEGWQAWDIRCAWKDDRKFPQPEWDGSDLKGKKLLMWGDQAIGEDIVQASYFDELLARGAQLIVELPPRLIPLFQRTWPQITFIKKPGVRDKAVVMTEQSDPLTRDPSISFKVQPLAAGKYLRGSFNDFPMQRKGYLKVNEKLRDKLRERYKAMGAKNVVGIAWRSTAKFGRYKSSQLDDWLPILRRPDTVFIDLQYGDNSAELAEFKQRYPDIQIYHDLEVNQMLDLDAFAAQVAACDRVVSISNTTVHFAGGVGVECHIMLPTGLGSLWYWFRERADSPWYPNTRLYRQSVAAQWSDVIGTVAAALDKIQA